GRVGWIWYGYGSSGQKGQTDRSELGLLMMPFFFFPLSSLSSLISLSRLFSRSMSCHVMCWWSPKVLFFFSFSLLLVSLVQVQVTKFTFPKHIIIIYHDSDCF